MVRFAQNNPIAARHVDANSEGLSVTRVSADLGYRNQSAFTQMFRYMTGKVPSDFKVATL